MREGKGLPRGTLLLIKFLVMKVFDFTRIFVLQQTEDRRIVKQGSTAHPRARQLKSHQ